jgi:ribosomal RNA-processing protein 12
LTFIFIDICYLSSCRIKSKYLFERLSRKFGHDLVASLVPKTDEKTHKRLKNIRKELARRARRVSEDGSGQDDADELSGIIRGRQKTMEELLADSSDDDLDDDLVAKSSGKEKGKGKKKGGGGAAAWIQEGGDGIVDLLSRDAASRILSTRPGTKSGEAAGAEGGRKRTRVKEESSNGWFKVGADGRLIITEKAGGKDSEDEEGERPPQKGTRYIYIYNNLNQNISV